MNAVNNVGNPSTLNPASGPAPAGEPKSGSLNGIPVKLVKGPNESPVGAPSLGTPGDVQRASNAAAAAQQAAGPTNLQVQGSKTFRQQVARDLNTFAPGTSVDSKGYVRAAAKQTPGHEQGYKLINDLLNGGKPVSIGYVQNNAYTQSGAGATGTPGRPGQGSEASVAYDPKLDLKLPTLQKNGAIKDEGIPSSVVLAHELVHAAHAQRGTIDRSLREHSFADGDQKYKENWRFEEFRTTGFAGFRQGNEPTENSIRAELGLNPRATYLDRSAWVPLR